LLRGTERAVGFVLNKAWVKVNPIEKQGRHKENTAQQQQHHHLVGTERCYIYIFSSAGRIGLS